jgi:hypothetical protein
MSKVITKLLREEFIMQDNNEMVTVLQTGSLVTNGINALERNPAADFFPAVNGLVK